MVKRNLLWDPICGAPCSPSFIGFKITNKVSVVGITLEYCSDVTTVGFYKVTNNTVGYCLFNLNQEFSWSS